MLSDPALRHGCMKLTCLPFNRKEQICNSMRDPRKKNPLSDQQHCIPLLLQLVHYETFCPALPEYKKHFCLAYLQLHKINSSMGIKLSLVFSIQCDECIYLTWITWFHVIPR